MKSFPKPLTPKEEKECLKRAEQGEQEAKDMLVEHNLRLVAHVVKKYQGCDYDMECWAGTPSYPPCRWGPAER